MLMSIIIIMSDRNVIFAQPIVTNSFLGLYFFVFLVLVFPVVFYVRQNSYCFLSNRISVSLVWVSRGRSYWVNKLFMLKSLIRNVSKKESLIYKKNCYCKKNCMLLPSPCHGQFYLGQQNGYVTFVSQQLNVRVRNNTSYYQLHTPDFQQTRGKDHAFPQKVEK